MNWLYEVPWWLPTCIGLIGLVFIVTGNNRLEKRLMYGGAGLILLAVALMLTSWFMESDREIVIRQTRELLASVEKRDWSRLEKLLSPDMVVSINDLQIEGRPKVIDTVRLSADKYDVKNLRVVGAMSTTTLNDVITVTVQVSIDVREWPNLVTNWQMEWEKTAAGWEARDIRFLGGPAISASSAASHVPSTP